MSSRLKLWLQAILIVTLVVGVVWICKMSGIWSVLVIAAGVVGILFLREDGIIVLRPSDLSDEKSEGDFERLKFSGELPEKSECYFYFPYFLDDEKVYVMARYLGTSFFYAIYVRRFVFEILLRRPWRHAFVEGLNPKKDANLLRRCKKMTQERTRKMSHPRIVYVKSE